MGKGTGYEQSGASQEVKPRNKMAPVTPEEPVVGARRGGSLICHGSRQSLTCVWPRGWLCIGRLSNLFLYALEFQICRNLLCRTVATQPGSQAAELGHTREFKELAQKG